jgi:hypothetical protein
MKDGLQGDKIDFTLTESAQEYLSKTLPDWVKQTSEQPQAGRGVRHGQSVIAGSIFLMLAMALMIFCFWIVP